MNHKVTVRVGRMLHKVGRLKKASDLTDSETNRMIFHLQKALQTEESAVLKLKQNSVAYKIVTFRFCPENPSQKIYSQILVTLLVLA